MKDCTPKKNLLPAFNIAVDQDHRKYPKTSKKFSGATIWRWKLVHRITCYDKALKVGIILTLNILFIIS